jgi:hypothetical protein
LAAGPGSVAAVTGKRHDVFIHVVDIMHDIDGIDAVVAVHVTKIVGAVPASGVTPPVIILIDIVYDVDHIDGVGLVITG